MSGSKLPLIALGVGAYLAFAITTMPASVAVRWLAPDTVALAGVQGTVWRGSASYGSVSGFAFSDLRWELRPAALLTARLGLYAETRLGNGFLRTSLTVSRSRIEFADLRAAIDVDLLNGLLPANAAGNASAELDSLVLVDGWPVEAAGSVRVQNLVSAPWIPVPGVSELAVGNFLAQFSGSNESMAVIVSDQGGPLELEGAGRFMPERRFEFDARIKPRPEASDLMVQALSIMAPASADGYHAIEHYVQL